MKYLLILTAALVTLFAAMRVSGQGRIVEMGITSTEMAQYFQAHAGSQDIARVDHPNDVGLIAGITVGKKMAIFKTASQISQFLSSSASSIDIVGYNLEPGQANDPLELANPVAAAQNVQAIARQYGKLVAIGLTHDLTLQYGAAMAPFADIWVLQIQKAQNDPQMASEFVNQMVPALVKANPAIKIFVQIRTDSQPAALASLVNGLGNVNVSILTQQSDVQDAINVASQFFGQGGQAVSQPVNFQPVGMANGSQYGIRVPAKAQGWFAPVASNLIGSNERDHLGRGSINAWDWSTSVGSPVFAIGPGTIRYAGCNDAGHYGCWVSISHGNGLQSDYAHCLENSIRVQDGQQVDASTQLCNIGRTGWTDWPHVHLAIKLNGTPQPIGNFFDTSLVVYCHFSNCQASNDPNAPIAGMGMQTASQQAQQPVSPYDRLIGFLRGVNPNLVSMSVVGIFALLCLIWWLGGLYERVFVVALGTSIAVVAVALWFILPMLQPTASQPAQQIAGTGAWKTAYAFMRRWEGGDNPPCVHDPIRTLKGVTNITYNAWRQSKGIGPGDVCKDLTDSQAQQIYYERYWLASGADKLSPATAIAVFDHAVNAGVGSAKGLLAQCGDNANCVIQARYADYKTKSNCPQYCKAWFSRVNDLVKFLQKGNSKL